MKWISALPFILFVALRAFAMSESSEEEDSTPWREKILDQIQSENPCPEKSHLRGSPPPQGNSVFCAYKGPGGYFKHGPELVFWKNGNPKSVIVWKDNMKEGPWVGYDLNGNLSEEGEYKGNKKEGKVTKYNGLAEPYMFEMYKAGEMISTGKIDVATAVPGAKILQGEQRFICQMNSSSTQRLKKALLKENPEVFSSPEMLKVPPIGLVEINMKKIESDGVTREVIDQFKFATKIKFDNSRMIDGTRIDMAELDKEISDKEKTLAGLYEGLENSFRMTLKNLDVWTVAIDNYHQEIARSPASEKPELPIKKDVDGVTVYVLEDGYSVYEVGNLTHVRAIKRERVGIMNIPTSFEVETKLFSKDTAIKFKMELENCKIF